MVGFLARAVQFHGCGHGGEQLFVLPGFEHKIDGPLLDGAHGHLDIAVCGDQQDDSGRVQLADLLEPVETLPAAGCLLSEVHVEEDDGRRLLLEGARNGLGIGLGADLVAPLLEEQAGGDEHVLVVVDDEDAGGFSRHGIHSPVYASGQ